MKSIQQQIEDLVSLINNYYECNLKDKKRDFVTLEARDMFIHISSTGRIGLNWSIISKTLDMSKSAILRAKKRADWLSKNDKFFKSRLNDLNELILNEV